MHALLPRPENRAPHPPNRPGVVGHLRLACDRTPSGKCILSHKEFKPPIHISKPYWNGHSLLLNLMCPTAGMLAGDSADLEIAVNAGASLTLSNPSSLRIHKMDRDGEANWTQSFRIEEGAFLESNPEWLILQGESALTQRTCIDIDKGGELYFIEAIAPGRVAHSEAFAFRQFRNRLALRYDNTLALLEKHRVEPARGTASAWTNQLGESYPFYLSILLASETLRSANDLWKAIHQLQDDGTKVGASQLAHPSCWCVKILAQDPIAARKASAAVRERFYQTIQRQPASLRR